MDASDIMLQFNRYLLDAIGSKILGSSIFSWESGLTKSILGICLVIALFQTIHRHGQNVLTEWVKVVFAAWFALAILGGVDYRTVPVLSSLDRVPPAYQVKNGGKPTLERAVFNFLSYKFDSLGNAIKESYSDTSLSLEISRLNQLQGNIVNASINCQPHETECMKQALSGNKPTVGENQEKKESMTALGKIADMLSQVFVFYLQMSNPAAWLFPILTWLLELIRGFINMFVLIGFGISAALGLFLLKVVTPIMVLPDYRPRVISMWKAAMSASLYGFAMNLVIWISIVLTQALVEASQNFVLSAMQDSAMGGSQIVASKKIALMLMNNFMVSFVIMCMQIVALAKVPKFCKTLMDLSLEQIVQIGETLLQAGMGVAKIAGMAAATVATGGASMLATGAMKGMTGSSVGNFVKGKLGGMSAQEQQAYGKSGGSKDWRNNLDKDGQGGNSSGMMGYGPSGGKGSSLESAALADTNMKATVKSKGGSILKKSDEATSGSPQQTKDGRPLTQEEKEDREQTRQESYDTQLASFNQSQDDKKAYKRSQKIDKALDYISPQKIVETAMNMAFDGLGAGVGMGDASASLKSVVGKGFNHAANAVTEQKDRHRDRVEGINQEPEEKFSFVDPLGPDSNIRETSDQRAIDAENTYRKAVIGGKREQTEEDKSTFEKNAQAIARGEASKEQMLQILQAKNSSKLDGKQSKMIETLKKDSEEFKNFSNKEDAGNNALMSRMQKEYSQNGSLSSASLNELSGKTAAGMIDLDQVAQFQSGNKTMKDILNDQADREISNTINPMIEKMNNSQALSQSEKQVVSELFANQQNRLVGQTEQLDKINRILSNTAKTDHLRISRNDATDTMEELVKALSDSSRNNGDARMSAEFGFSRESIEEGGRNIKTNNFDGINVGGNNIKNSDDYNKLSNQNRQLVDDMAHILEMYEKDKESKIMVDQRLPNMSKEDIEGIKKLIEKIKKS